VRAAGLMLSRLLAKSGMDNVAIDTRHRNEIETMSIQPGGARGVSASLSANTKSNDLCYQQKTLQRTAIVKFLHLIVCQSCTFNACVPMMRSIRRMPANLRGRPITEVTSPKPRRRPLTDDQPNPRRREGDSPR
jgi:hypothetical protein